MPRFDALGVDHILQSWFLACSLWLKPPQGMQLRRSLHREAQNRK